MNAEIEIKFLHIDHNKIRSELRRIGAVCESPMRLMRRVTFDSAAMKAKNGWIRVRDEGNDKATITYKQVDSAAIDGMKEIETTVGDFDSAVAIMQQLKFEGSSFQESKRESWQLGEVQIELDLWPWLDPYIEIEAPSEAMIRRVVEMLGLNMSNAIPGDVMVAYRNQYPHLGAKDTIGNLAEVRFDSPLPDLLIDRGI